MLRTCLNLFLKSITCVTACIALMSCSSGGSCNGCNPPAPQFTLSLSSVSVSSSVDAIITIPSNITLTKTETFYFSSSNTNNAQIQSPDYCSITPPANSCSVHVLGVNAPSTVVISVSNSDYSITPLTLNIVPLINYLSSVDSGYSISNSAYESPGNIFVCTQNNLSSTFSNCQISNGGINNWSPLAMGFLKVNGSNYAYVTSSSYYLGGAPDAIYSCNVDSNGLLSNCNAPNGTTFIDPYNLNTYKGHVYVTDWAESGYGFNIYMCTPVANGQIENCSRSNGGVVESRWNPDSIGFNNGHAYIADYYNSNIYKCDVGADGNLNDCAINVSGLDDTIIQYPTGITFYTGNNNQSYAYIAYWATGGYVSTCNVAESDGGLNNCDNSTSPTFNHAEQLTVNGSYLYVAASNGGGYDGGPGSLTRCGINPDTGAIESATCTVLNNPESTDWYPSQVSFNPFN